MSSSIVRRRQRRASSKKPPSLNLVSLMDIFTILVFFLLVNSSDVQQPGGDKLRLPEARIEKPIEDALTILVDDDAITIQGRKIVDLAAVEAEPDAPIIQALVDELKYQANRGKLSGEPVEERPVTLMANREIDFRLMKKIMASASRAEYTELSLAVIGQAKEPNQ